MHNTTTNKTISKVDSFPIEVFGDERCPKCNGDGAVIQTNIGTFHWECPNCNESWIPSGSVMDVFNDMHYEALPDLYDGL